MDASPRGSKPEELSDWDPASAAYQNEVFNCYTKPRFNAKFLETCTATAGVADGGQSISPAKGVKRKARLYVGNIPLALSKEGLIGFFSRVAPVLSARILPSKDPERGTNFGFVDVGSISDAQKIVQEFNNYSFGTKYRLRVNLADSEEERQRKKLRMQEDEEFYEKLCQEYSATSENNEAGKSEKDLAKKDRGKNQLPGKDENGQMEPLKQKTKLCVSCSKEGSKACSRCKACYCSVECQRKHWPAHQKHCEKPSPVKQVSNIRNFHDSKQCNPQRNKEKQLINEMEACSLEGEVVFNINDVKLQSDPSVRTKVVIYVVENMLMKGQAIDAKETEEFLALMQKLGGFFKECRQPLSSGGCRAGALVLFDYHGEVTRGAVTGFSKEKLEATVLAIDYGNKESVMLSDLYPMPRFAIECPRQCRTLVLHGMPSDLDARTTSVLSSHLRITVEEKIFALEVKGKDNGIYSVVLCTEDTAACVNDEIISIYESLKTAAKESRQSSPPSKRVMLQEIPLQQLPEEPDFDVIITDVTSPSCFFAQIISKDKSNIAKFSALHNQLQKYDELCHLPSYTPVINEACVAFFPDDQSWSRGVVEQINRDATVKIFFFDHGNIEDLDIRYVRAISEELALLPRQARQFSLFGVRSSSRDGQWSDEAKALFKDTLLNEPICSVSAISMQGDNCLAELYLPIEKIYPYKLLLDKGLALTNDDNEFSRPKEEKNPIFTLQSNAVASPGKYRVIPVHFESPHEFYVQIADPETIHRVSEFDMLLRNYPLVPYVNPVIGDSCCALFTDDAWYRAKVVSVEKACCTVYFYDYGNTAVVPLMNLRGMPEEMRSLRGQAIRIELGNVRPAGESWSGDAKDFMESNLSFQPCILNVSKVEEGVSTGSLTLEEGDLDVARMLIDAKVARFLLSMNGSAVSTNEVAGEKSTPLLNTHAATGALSSREPFNLEIEKVGVSSRTRVIPVHFESPHEFYVQIADPETIHRVSEFDMLLRNSPLVPYVNPVIGDSCCALFTDDAWYRAKVVSVEKACCTVYFYDYGNTAVVPLMNLRGMPEEMRSLRGQAIRIELGNVRPAGESWSGDAKDFMESNLSFQPCILNVSKVEEGVSTGSLTLEEGDLDVARMLIDAKVARFVLSMNGSAVSTNEVAGENSTPLLNTHVATGALSSREQFTLEIEKVGVSSRTRVIPVHFESPHEFYVQIADPETIHRVSEFDMLLRNYPLVPYVNPVIGDSCCALFTDDAWYRAKVVSVEKACCTVYFYDYGNTAVVPLMNLRGMPEEMRSLRGQAIRIELGNVRPAGESWSVDAKDFMESNLSFQPCILNVSKVEEGVSTGSLTREEDRFDVCIELVSAGLACKAEKFHGTCSLEMKRQAISESREMSDLICSENSTGVISDNASLVTKIESGEEADDGNSSKQKTTAVAFDNNKLKSNDIKRNSHRIRSRKSNESDRSTESSSSCSEISHGCPNRRNFGRRGRGGSRSRKGSRSSHREQVCNAVDCSKKEHQYSSNFTSPLYPFYPPFVFPPIMLPPNGFPIPINSAAGVNTEGAEYRQEYSADDHRQNRVGSFPGHQGHFGQDRSPVWRHDQGMEEWANAWYQTALNVHNSKAINGYNSSRGPFRGRGALNSDTKPPIMRRYRKLPQAKLPPSLYTGAEVEGKVSFIEHPYHFYIKMLNDAMEIMLRSAVYNSAEPVTSIETGTLVAAKSGRDGQFFRAVIENVYSKGKVSVRDPDSGITEIIDKSALRTLHPEDREKAFKAIRCTLYNVKPKIQNRWSNEATRYMRHKLDGTEKVQLVVRGENSFALIVSIRDPEDSVEFIGQDMVNLGFANFWF